MKIAEQPAFPIPPGKYLDYQGVPQWSVGNSGITKRELAAFMAMQSLLSTITMSRNEAMPFVVESARQYADALLAELEKAK